MDEQSTPQSTSQPPAAPPAAAPQPFAPQPFAPPQAVHRHRRLLLIGGSTALAIGIAAGGVGAGIAIADVGHAGETATASRPTMIPGDYRPSRTWYGGEVAPGAGGGSLGAGAGAGAGSGSTGTPATAAQKAGVVTIVSQIGYDGQSEAAGTGMILTSGGRVLTNNHVVEGSTAIAVTVESTGAQYTAEVVGTDPTDDVAVLQLVGADGAKVGGLTPVSLDADGATVGEAVTDVGNAGGTGDLVTAEGTVADLDQTIQVADESTGAEKTLNGLVELDADIVAGDSGGPVLDAQGEVVGMATAASSGTADVTGYAIPIETAMSVVDRIVAGDASGTITIGLPAFLGVELAPQQTGEGVLVAGALAGLPAAQAGIGAGATITAVDGVAVNDPTALSAAIAGHAVGDSVTISWTDAGGTAQQSTVALVAGPAS